MHRTCSNSQSTCRKQNKVMCYQIHGESRLHSYCMIREGFSEEVTSEKSQPGKKRKSKQRVREEKTAGKKSPEVEHLEYSRKGRGHCTGGDADKGRVI